MNFSELPSGVEAWPGDGWPLTDMIGELKLGVVSVGPRVAMPNLFHITIEGVEASSPWALTLMYQVNGDTSEFVAALAGGGELHELLARVAKLRPLRWWHRRAQEHVLAEQAESDRYSYLDALEADPGLAEANIEELFSTWDRDGATEPKPSVGRRRNRITREFLAEVAEVYRRAWAAGDPPTKTVAEHFVAAHSTAAKWVMQARDAQLLGPADGKRGGEAEVAPELDRTKKEARP